MHREAFTDGVHHLACEQLEPATFRTVHRVLAFEVVVEKIQSGGVLASLFLLPVSQVRFLQNRPAMARDRFLALADHAA